MIIKVQFAKDSTAVELQCDGPAAAASVAMLHQAIEEQMDIPVHKQKLISKGKVLDKSQLLSKYNVGDGGKVMLMASGGLTQGQIVARQQSDIRRQQADKRRQERVSSSVAGQSQPNVRSYPFDFPAALTSPTSSTNVRFACYSKGTTVQDTGHLIKAADSMPERLKRWKATGVVSLGELQLTELPEGFGEAVASLQGDRALSAITAADMGNNMLQELPGAVSQLSGLRRLRCSHNRITTDGVPWQALCNLSQLTRLSLDHNCMLVLDAALFQITSIEALDVSSNALSSIPEGVTQLQSLVALNLGCNKLRTLPDCLGECSNLVVLEAPTNAISQIPESLKSLKSLKSLNLANNRIAAIPTEVLEGCKELHTLDVRDNPVRMQQLRETPGYKQFEERRKVKLDKIVDAKIGADFWESADYDAFQRH